MKKLILPSILALAALLAASCKGGEAEDPTENYSFESVHYATEGLTGDLRESADAKYGASCDSIRINLNLLRDGISEEVAKIIDSEILATAFGEQYRDMDISDAMAAFADSISEGYISDCASEIVQYGLDAPDYAYMHQHFIDGDVFSMGKDYLQYVVSSYDFTGGAHGYSADRYMTFDTNTGKRITVNDIVSNSDRLLKILTGKVRQDDRAFEDAEVFIPEVFLFDEEGMTFIYDTYSIGCYASGPIDITLSKGELKGILRPGADKYWE